MFEKDDFLLVIFVVLATLSFLTAPFLVWVCYAPLLLYGWKKKSVAKAMLAIFIFVYIVPLKLEPEIELSLAIVVFSFFAFFFSFYYVGTRKENMFLPAIVWMVLLLLFSFIPLGSFWANIAYMFPYMSPFIQVVKGYGITFFIILCNSLFALVFLKRKKEHVRLLFLFCALILASFSYTKLYAPSYDIPKIALVQGNIDETWQYRVEHASEIVDRYIQLSNEKVDIVVWPEYAIPIDITLNDDESKKNFQKIRSFVRRKNVYLVAGMIGVEKGALYDRTILFNPNGDLISERDALSVVPFNQQDIQESDTEVYFDVLGNKVGIVSCFEEVLYKTSSSHKKNNADFLFVLSNNQMFGEFGIRYLSQFAQLRAAENNLFVFRVVNTGISKIIDPYGNVVKESKVGEIDVVLV